MMTYENQNLMTSVDDTMTLLMADEVAALLMVGKNRVYELLNENKLKGMKIGKKSWRI
ncbi:MAG: helix-turn-helix domain-containing protein, partial [Blautia sp.]|nr:helix-turn-helix domain-containing protein [Blautia sp.]